MSLTRADKEIFPFFHSCIETPVTEPGVSESFINSGYNTMTIEVSRTDNIEMYVEACINVVDRWIDEDGMPRSETLQDSDCWWTGLKIMNMNTYEAVDTITGPGIYMVSITGCQRVRVGIDSIGEPAVIVGVAED